VNPYPSRDEPLFLDVWNQPLVPYPDIAFAHRLDVRVASRRPDGTAVTMLVDLPPRWRAADVSEGTLELFVVDGAISADGRALGSGGYVAVPAGVNAELGTPAGARVLAFWNADSVIDAACVSLWDVLRSSTEAKLRTTDGNGDGPAGWLFFAIVKAGFWSPEEHVHEGWEENILLRGDLLMPTPDRGVMTPGFDLANPPGFWHGPMTSKGGALFLIHTDEPQTVEYRTSSVPADVLTEYLETSRW
jgi:hypothetical protein